jgi:hypothetical protein
MAGKYKAAIDTAISDMMDEEALARAMRASDREGKERKEMIKDKGLKTSPRPKPRPKNLKMAKGGYVNCGASVPATQTRKK